MFLSRQAQDDIEEIIQQWIAFSNRKAIYDQIRYIDGNGDEVIRVNYHADGVSAVPREELQNKKNRYYFTDTMSLQKNQVFVSKLDLNIENDVIEQPLKPMLRLATPYYGISGGLEGMVILNYAAQELLQQVGKIASSSMGGIFLLNMDGYWLYNGMDSAKEWAFMYEDRLDVSFANEYPDEWERMKTADSGRIETSNGVFCFTKLDLAAEIADGQNAPTLFCDSGIFTIVSFIPSDSETGALFANDYLRLIRKVLVKYISIYFLLSGFAFALAAFIAINRAQKKEIKYFSEFDAMTGVYNRRSGYEKLNELRKDVGKKNCKIAVCFIDINGLKEVNDILGHDAGDELIRTAVGAIKENVRGKDFIARLGGDEFLIVFDSLDAEGAEKVWERIVQKFGQINEGENRPYIISVSHGIGAFLCDANMTVDEVISRADQKMYLEKREIKKSFKAIRDIR